MQNLVTIPRGISFPHTREIARLKCLLHGILILGAGWFFQRPTAEAPEQIFTQNMSNEAVPG